MKINLKELFESWGQVAQSDYVQQQWLLSKWEVVEGIVWPNEKIQMMTQTIVDGLMLAKEDCVVDLGCGGGWILKQLQPHVGKIVGLDFSEAMLINARQFCPSETFVCGEIGRLPFKKQSFDCALSYFVFLNFLDDDFVEHLATLKASGLSWRAVGDHYDMSAEAARKLVKRRAAQGRQ